MMDAVQALLAGPNAAEAKRGLKSMIPPGTKLLSATVRGTTAYLNFNDDFQLNSYGIEGYVAQLKQIIFTVTEFSTVGDVQFLIEGRRLDYLGGDGVWIGSPLTRTSF
jgi:spore germination protein GerM